MAQRLRETPERERRNAVTALVLAKVAEVLGHAAADRADRDRGFLDMGVDSLMAVDLRNRIEAAAGLRLPSTAVFDHPTPIALSEFVLAELTAAQEEPELPLLAGLDEVEARLDSLPKDARARLSTRLSGLLTRLAAVAEPGTGLTERLDSASDDEIFDFIDQELGADHGTQDRED
jgi:acyl carrier protein